MTTNNASKGKLDDEKKEIADLKARIAELVREKEETPRVYEEKLESDSYIPVMSLLPFTLNLSTKEQGQGNVKKFTKFGEVKRILYRDLVDIMEANPQFLEAGFYYILDPRVIRFHGLEEAYAKILTKDKIEDVLSANSEEGLSLYNTANPEQQKIIIGLIVDKLADDPKSVNLNVVDSISRVSGVNINEKVEDTKTLLEQLTPKE